MGHEVQLPLGSGLEGGHRPPNKAYTHWCTWKAWEIRWHVAYLAAAKSRTSSSPTLIPSSQPARTARHISGMSGRACRRRRCRPRPSPSPSAPAPRKRQWAHTWLASRMTWCWCTRRTRRTWRHLTRQTTPHPPTSPWPFSLHPHQSRHSPAPATRSRSAAATARCCNCGRPGCLASSCPSFAKVFAIYIVWNSPFYGRVLILFAVYMLSGVVVYVERCCCICWAALLVP